MVAFRGVSQAVWRLIIWNIRMPERNLMPMFTEQNIAWATAKIAQKKHRTLSLSLSFSLYSCLYEYLPFLGIRTALLYFIYLQLYPTVFPTLFTGLDSARCFKLLQSSVYTLPFCGPYPSARYQACLCPSQLYSTLLFTSLYSAPNPLSSTCLCYTLLHAALL